MLVDNEKIKELEILFDQFIVLSEDGSSLASMIKTYKCEKPLMSFELHNVRIEHMTLLKTKLSKYFYTEYVSFDSEPQGSKFSGDLYISRFRHVLEVAVEYSRNNGYLDEFADLIGILIGYSGEEVAKYCLSERMDQFDLIK